MKELDGTSPPWHFRCGVVLDNDSVLVKISETSCVSSGKLLSFETFCVKKNLRTTNFIKADQFTSFGVPKEYWRASKYQLKEIAVGLAFRFHNIRAVDAGLERVTAYVGGHKLDNGQLLLAAANRFANNNESGADDAAKELEILAMRPVNGASYSRILSKEELHRLGLGVCPSRKQLADLFNRLSLPEELSECPQLPEQLGSIPLQPTSSNQEHWPEWCKDKLAVFGGVFELDGKSMPLTVFNKGVRFAVVGLDPTSREPLYLSLNLEQGAELSRAGYSQIEDQLADNNSNKAQKKAAAKQLCTECLTVERKVGRPPLLKLKSQQSPPTTGRKNSSDEVSVSPSLGTLTCGSTVCTYGRALKKKAMKISGCLAVVRVYEVDGVGMVRAFFPRSEQTLECSVPAERGLESIDDFCDMVCESLELESPSVLRSCPDAFDEVDALPSMQAQAQDESKLQPAQGGRHLCTQLSEKDVQPEAVCIVSPEELTRFPWEHSTNQGYNAHNLDLIVDDAENNVELSTTPIPDTTDLENILQFSPVGSARIKQLQKLSQVRRQLSSNQSESPLRHTRYSSHPMTLDSGAEPSFQEHPAAAIISQPSPSQHTESKRSSSGKGSPNARQVNFKLPSQSPAERDQHNDRSDTLHSFKHLGYANGKSAYLKKWRGKLQKSQSFYPSQLDLLKSVSELRKCLRCTNEEAFCALADSGGVVGEAFGRLSDTSFEEEVQLLCKMIDVKKYMTWKPTERDQTAPETVALPTSKKLPDVVLAPGSSRAGSRKVLLDGLTDIARKHELHATQMKSVLRLSAPQYKSNQRNHRQTMVTDELGSLDLSTQSIELVGGTRLHQRSLHHVL